MEAERKCFLQIILSLLKEKVAKQPLGAEDLAAAATVAVGVEVAPKASARSIGTNSEKRSVSMIAGHCHQHVLSLEEITAGS